MPPEDERQRDAASRQRLVEQLRERVAERDVAAIRAVLSGTLPEDVAELLEGSTFDA